MRCLGGISLITCVGRVLAQQQQPLSRNDPDNDANVRLNFSSPSPLIFHSIFGPLQQWPNSFFSNGHTVAPYEVAKNTNLYHARGDNSFPPSPEWFAFDSAMSYFIAGAMSNSHMLTFRTTRNVECLYFDGTSASLADDGSMDSQMLLLHNTSANVPDRPAFEPAPSWDRSNGTGPCVPGNENNCIHWNPLQAEHDRASGLCDFIRDKKLGGVGWGFEGIVRMNAAFELIWCDFSSPSVKLVSWLNTTVPLLDGVHPPGPSKLGLDTTDDEAEIVPPDMSVAPGRRPMPGSGNRWPGADHSFQAYSMFEWFHVVTKRYGFVGSRPGRGEARISISSCGLSTLCDPSLQDQEQARIADEQVLFNLTSMGDWEAPADPGERSEVLKELSRRRRSQRPRNVSNSIGLYLRSAVEHRLQTAFASDVSSCSGVDWLLTAQEIVSFYAGDIDALLALTDTNMTIENGTSLRLQLGQLRNQAHNMWIPFYKYPILGNISLNEDTFAPSAPQSRAALNRCKAQYELIIGHDQISPSERVTYGAITEILRIICAYTLPVFLKTEQLWLAHFNNASAAPAAKTHPVLDEVAIARSQHHAALEELMTWLGWSDQWTTCTPECGMHEVCYIPIWPTMGPSRPPKGYNGYDKEPCGRGRSSGSFKVVGRETDMLEQYLWKPRCIDAEHPPTMRPGEHHRNVLMPSKMEAPLARHGPWLSTRTAFLKSEPTFVVPRNNINDGYEVTMYRAHRCRSARALLDANGRPEQPSTIFRLW